MLMLSITVKLIAGLIGLFLVTRLVGKKALSEFTPFDFIYALVLGGILEESLYDENVTIVHILIALAAWGILIFIAEALVQNVERLKNWIKGKPSVLVHNATLNYGELKRNHIELEQLRGMLRQQGSFSLESVRHAVMELDGQVSIKIREETEDVFTYLVVDEGEPEYGTLTTIGQDENWLLKSMAELGYTDLKKVLYAEWSEEKGFYVILYVEAIDRDMRIES